MIHKFIESYGYNSYRELFQSLFPSTKYAPTAQTAGMSSVIGAVCAAVDIWPVLIIAMILIMSVELGSGLVAAHKKQEKFESAKFSRFVLKLCIWFILFISTQLFSVIARQQDPNMVWMATGWLFDLITVILMVCFVVENTTSVLENLAVIDGKDKSYFIDLIMQAVKVTFSKLLGKKIPEEDEHTAD